jgi:hypothetical protein
MAGTEAGHDGFGLCRVGTADFYGPIGAQLNRTAGALNHDGEGSPWRSKGRAGNGAAL